MIDPTFTRATVAYTQNGAQVLSGAPRYESAKFGNGITIEEATTNICSANQSDVETNTTGFYGNILTISRDTGQYFAGAASLKAVATNSGQSAQFDSSYYPSASAGTTYYAQVRIKGTASYQIGMVLAFYNAAKGWIGNSNDSYTLTGGWDLCTTTMTAPAGTYYAQIAVYNNYAGAHTFYIDQWQIAAKSYWTSWQIGGTARNAEVLTIPGSTYTTATGTAEAWINLLRAPGTNNQYILDMNGAANKSCLFYVKTTGVLECIYGTGSSTKTITGSNTLSAGTLYHVAIVWSSSGVTIYLNGAAEATDATAHGIVPGTTSYIGTNASSLLHLDGIIDDFRIWNYVRSADTIAYDATGVGGLATSSILYGLSLSNLTHVESMKMSTVIGVELAQSIVGV